MSRSFGLVDSKVQEAEYFLDRILEADHFFFGVQCDAVAFAASARSVTFAMQSSLTGSSPTGRTSRRKPSSEVVPVEDSRMQLGTWRGIFLFEHRQAAHRRKVLVTVMGD